MQIRKANINDIDGILKLLSQVLEIHAAIRPDIFIPGTTKYTKEQLCEILGDNNRPVYVAAENGVILGYSFCIIRYPEFSTTMKPAKTLYIDDFCVDSSARGKGLGKKLFEYVKSQAKQFGCDCITLAVWEGNYGARAFYEKIGMTPKETIMEFKLI